MTTPSNRLFVELVNNLTSPAAASLATSTSNPSALDLSGFAYTLGDPYSGGCWDLVFTADDPESRPEPFRGDLVAGATSNAKWYGLLPLTRDTFGGTFAAYNVILPPLNNNSAALPGPGGTATSIPAPQPAGTTPPSPPTNYFYVIGDLPTSTPGNENGTPLQTTYWPTPTTTANTATTPNIPANAATLTQAFAPTFDPMNGTAPSTNPFTVYQGVLPGAQGPTPTNPSGVLPTTYSPKIPPPPTTQQQTVTYYWACLRRPANPLAPVSATNPMIVVDSMRFPYIGATGVLQGNPAIPNLKTANTVYSVQRFQPLRGGHSVPYFAPPAAAGTLPNPPLPTTPPALDAHYGFTDQIVPPGTGIGAWSQLLKTQGFYTATDGNNYPATNIAYHTLGWANEVTENSAFFPFHDRDFTSVGELTLVPGCPPGLLTKQFTENVPSISFVNTTAQPSTANPSPFINNVAPAAGTAASNALNTPMVFPYLSDRFFYTSASPQFNGSPTTWDPVSGPSSGGWFKMFEIFEVPSPVFGSIGQVAQGSNYDWLRQDTKPGLMNLNLIIDEEAFLGLMGNAGNITPQPGTITIPAGGATYTLQQVLTPPPSLNTAQVTQDNTGNLMGPLNTPQVVTLWNPTTRTPAALQWQMTSGTTTQLGAYPVSSVGFFDSSLNANLMKACFSDFLKLRHGGTGYAFGQGPEAPFHSLSYPDINYTAFRPALPPNGPSGTSGTVTITAGTPPTATYSANGDAGVRPTRTFTGGTVTIYPPALPAPPAVPDPG